MTKRVVLLPILLLLLLLPHFATPQLSDITADFFFFELAESARPHIGESVEVTANAVAFGQHNHGFASPNVHNLQEAQGALDVNDLTGPVDVATRANLGMFANATRIEVYGLTQSATSSWSLDASWDVPFILPLTDPSTVSLGIHDVAVGGNALVAASVAVDEVFVVAVFRRVAADACPAPTSPEAILTPCTPATFVANTAWQRVGLLYLGREEQRCGSSVAALDPYVVVGCPGNNSALVLHVDAAAPHDTTTVDTLWIDASTESGSPISGAEAFGAAVYITDRHVVVGAPKASEFLNVVPPDAGDGLAGSGAVFVYQSPVAAIPAPPAAAAASLPRVCRVAGPISLGEMGASLAASSFLDTTIIMAGLPSAKRVAAIAVHEPGSGVSGVVGPPEATVNASVACRLQNTITGFRETGGDDLGAAVGYDDEIGYFGSPTSDNGDIDSRAALGRLYVKAFCFPNRYIRIDFSQPSVLQCAACPGGRESAGGDGSFSRCTTCANAADKPTNALWVPSGGCMWTCAASFFGSGCDTCSVYRAGSPAQSAAALPTDAHWLDGIATCVWGCDAGFLLAAHAPSRADLDAYPLDGLPDADTNGTWCLPPPVPAAVDHALASPNDTTASAATLVFYEPGHVEYAALIALDVEVSSRPGDSAADDPPADVATLRFPFSAAGPASPEHTRLLADLVAQQLGGDPNYDRPALSMLVTPLLAQQQYRLRVAAGNVGGMGPFSPHTAWVSTLDPTAPGRPTAVTAGNVTGSSMVVQWDPPLDTGGQPQTGFTVCRTDSTFGVAVASVSNTTLCTEVYSAGGAAAAVLVSGLQAHTDHYFWVQVENGVGVSDASAVVGPLSTGAPSQPSAPVSPTCLPVSGSRVSVTWAPPSDLGGIPLGQMQYAVLVTDVAASEPVVAFTSLQPTSATNLTLTGLTAETTYFLYVTAVSGPAGVSSGVAPSAGAPMACTTLEAAPPSAPDMLFAGDTTSSTMLLQWTVPDDDGGDPVNAYQVVSTRESTGDKVVTVVGALDNDATVVSLSVSGLHSVSTYNVTVTARNSAGHGPSSNALTATTLDPVPPAAVAAPTRVAATGGSVTVGWDPPIDLGGLPLLRYDVFISTNSLDFTLAGSVPAGGGGLLRFHQPGLAARQPYFFSVAAVNALAPGPDTFRSGAMFTSNTTAPLPVSAPSASGLTPSSAVVEWTPPVDTGGLPITHFVVSFTATAGLDPNHAPSDAGGQVVVPVSPAPVPPGTPPPTNSTVLTGLLGGVSYSFTVAAANGVGAGVPASASPATVTLPAPSLPGEVGDVLPVNASSLLVPLGCGPSNTSVTVSWWPPADTGAALLLSYALYVSTSPSFGGGVTPGVTPPDAVVVVNNTNPDADSSALVYYTFTGLDPSTAYYTAVAAENTVGFGPVRAAESSVTTTGGGLALPAVSGASVSSVGPSGFNVEWAAPAGTPLADIASYTVLVFLLDPPGVADVVAGCGAGVLPLRLTSVPGDATSLDVALLAGNTSYAAVVVAVGTSRPSSAPSDPVTATTLPAVSPSVPDAPIADGVTADSLTLHVPTPTNNGGSPVVSLQLNVSVASSPYVVTSPTWRTVTILFATPSLTGLPPFVRVTVASVVASSQYTVTTVATSAAGLSSAPSSPSAAITTLAAVPPSPVTATPRPVTATASTVDLQWVTPASDGGAPLAAFVVDISTDDVYFNASQVLAVGPAVSITPPTGAATAVSTAGGDAAATLTVHAEFAAPVPGSTAVATVTGLVADTPYFFRVRSTSAAGVAPSGPSPTSHVAITTAAVHPTAPVAVTATSPSPSSLALSWQPPVDLGGQTLGCYEVEMVEFGALVRSCAIDGFNTSTGLAVAGQPAPFLNTSSGGDPFAAAGLPFFLNATHYELVSPPPTAYVSLGCVSVDTNLTVTGLDANGIYGFRVAAHTWVNTVMQVPVNVSTRVTSEEQVAVGVVNGTTVYEWRNVTRNVTVPGFQPVPTEVNPLQSPVTPSVLVLQPPSVPSAPNPPGLAFRNSTDVDLGFAAPSDDGGCRLTTLTLYRSRTVEEALPNGTITDVWRPYEPVWVEDQTVLPLGAGVVPLEDLVPSIAAIAPIRYVDHVGVRQTFLRYYLQAGNAVGLSVPSDELVTHTLPVAPSAVPVLSVVPAWTNPVTIGLRWRAPEDDGGLVVSAYVVQRTTPPSSAFETIVEVPAPGHEYGFVPNAVVEYNASAAVIYPPPPFEMLPNTTYAFRVAARSDAGVGPYSPVANATTDPPIACPADCSGNGTCAPWDGTCTCFPGYLLPDCGHLEGSVLVAYLAGNASLFDGTAFVEQLADVTGQPASRFVVMLPPPYTVLRSEFGGGGRRRVLQDVVPADDGDDVAVRVQFLVRFSNGTSTPVAAVIDQIVAAGTPPSTQLSSLGFLAVQPSLTAPPVVVSTSNCNRHTTCSGCLEHLDCGWCSVTATCSYGTALAPAPTEPVCSYPTTGGPSSVSPATPVGPFYHHALNPSIPLSTCPAPCHDVGTCGGCSTRPDCLWCDATDQCHQVAEAYGVTVDPPVTCPVSPGLGWIDVSRPAVCPATRCDVYSDVVSCASDLKCGWCSNVGDGSARCMAGDAFGAANSSACATSDASPTDPLWCYGPPAVSQCSPTSLPCSALTSCSACASRTECGWCVGDDDAQCVDADASRVAPLGGATCAGTWTHPFTTPSSTCKPSVEQQCSAVSTQCQSCLVAEAVVYDKIGRAVGSEPCSWCDFPSAFSSSRCTPDSPGHRAACETAPTLTFCYEHCGNKATLNTTGTIRVGSVDSDSPIDLLYSQTAACTWTIIPTDQRINPDTGQTEFVRYPIVEFTLRAYHLAVGDALEVYSDSNRDVALGFWNGTGSDVTGGAGSITSESAQMQIVLRTNGDRSVGTGFVGSFVSRQHEPVDVYLIAGTVLTAVCVCLCCLCGIHRLIARQREDEADFDLTLDEETARAQRTGEGAPPAVINAFPVWRFTKARLAETPLRDQNPDELQCAVCLCDFEEGDAGGGDESKADPASEPAKGDLVRVLGCLHAFHAACLDTWLKRKRTCPCCRADVLVQAAERASLGPGDDPLAVGPGMEVSVDAAGNLLSGTESSPVNAALPPPPHHSPPPPPGSPSPLPRDSQSSRSAWPGRVTRAGGRGGGVESTEVELLSMSGTAAAGLGQYVNPTYALRRGGGGSGAGSGGGTGRRGQSRRGRRRIVRRRVTTQVSTTNPAFGTSPPTGDDSDSDQEDGQWKAGGGVSGAGSGSGGRSTTNPAFGTSPPSDAGDSEEEDEDGWGSPSRSEPGSAEVEGSIPGTPDSPSPRSEQPAADSGSRPTSRKSTSRSTRSGRRGSAAVSPAEAVGPTSPPLVSARLEFYRTPSPRAAMTPVSARATVPRPGSGASV